jgi:hypothetical protein
VTVRSSGIYAVTADGTRPVAYREGDVVVLRAPDGRLGAEHTYDELERLDQVTVTAVWHGVRVSVEKVVTGTEIWVRTHDADLALRLALHRIDRDAWQGTARASDLTDIQEDVVDLLESEGRRP